jgi:uncharacterized protein (DUF58 family)
MRPRSPKPWPQFPFPLVADGGSNVLTRNGVAVLVLAASAFVLGRIFGLLEMHVVGVGLVLLVAFSIATAVPRSIDISVERTTDPASPEVGDPSTVQLAVTARRRTPVIELWEPVGEMTGASMRLAPLRSGTTARAAYTLMTARRGVVRVGPMSAEIHDPFGLARRQRWVAPARDILIRPRTVPLALPSIGTTSGPLARRLFERSAGSTAADEFRSLRDYVQGDDLRRVHWGATARRGELLIRESDPAASLNLVAVLDLAAGSYQTDPNQTHDHPDEAFELAVSAAASLATSAATTSRHLTLLTSDGEHLPCDIAHLDATLDRLAAIAPSSDRVPPPSRRAASSLMVSMVLTGRHGVERGRRLATVAGPTDGAVIVACGATTDPMSRSVFVLTPQNPAELAEQWHTLVDPRGAR